MSILIILFKLLLTISLNFSLSLLHLLAKCLLLSTLVSISSIFLVSVLGLTIQCVKLPLPIIFALFIFLGKTKLQTLSNVFNKSTCNSFLSLVLDLRW